MGDYQKIVVKKNPKVASRKNPETRYWRRFKSPILIKEYASIPSIYFSPVAPYDFAVTSSTRVQIYSSKTHQPKKTISRFKDIAYSASFRHDGKLVVAGDATGLVQVFDVNSRAILRTFREHTMPVHVTRFSKNNVNVLSASDDRTVRVWDIPTEASVNVFEDHEDYVRTGLVSDENPNLVMTGSYDQTVKLWDMRQNGCVMTMNHGAPVESILMYPGGGAVVSAGGPTLKVWDLLGGGRCMHAISNHQKTITSLCFDGSSSRLVTGSLDHHVKVYNVEDYKVVHSVKYPAPVLSVALSPDDSHLVVGMANGLLSIRQRQIKSAEVAAKKQKDERLRTGAYKYFTQTRQDDFVVERERTKRLRKYDQFLKKFQYGNALDEVLREGVHEPAVVAALLLELIHRDGLKTAITGRDDVSLEPLVRFLIKHIHHPRYTNLVIDVTDALIDIYSPVFGQSPIMDDLLKRLLFKVKQEVAFQKELAQTVASLDMLFARSGASSSASLIHTAPSSTVASPRLH
ncbi:WD40-repeat-containing domain protein [Radiomyces spectabilis]|uniref:WD40-repeat-containing domain protein n=1 Tax=Radiomyces spectabilis TaxID=64574 RepID=UPI00221F89A3|nr:WD40-repeat-containing domain protein [Radiomyces spectabilis]KAI8366834.1 WD40-repeat-containing domain protein [Radiomyces spectabilis]